MISVIVVAAGSSRRMGFDKLSARINGQSVLHRSVGVFQQSDLVGEIVVVTNEDHASELRDLRLSKLQKFVSGGAERHLSVWNGIQAVSADSELIAVHDGARPLVSNAALNACAQAAQRSGAASLAHRVVETLKRSQPGKTIATDSVSREDLWAMQTPQIFSLDILNRAYRHILESGDMVTDEVSAVQAIGHPVTLVENHDPNPKITVPSDLALAEAYLSQG